MAEHIPGQDPPSWTCKDVEGWLKAAFRAMPYALIYARGSASRTVTSDTPSATFDILAFAVTVLGAKSKECMAFLVWARAQVAKGSVGETVSDTQQYYRKRGRSSQRALGQRIRNDIYACGETREGGSGIL